MNLIKNLEETLDKKKRRLQKYLEEKNKLEVKIKKLQSDVEILQAKQFEQFKKAAKKENIEIRVDDIPEILQLIKHFQQSSQTDSEETELGTLETSLDTDIDDENAAKLQNGLSN